MLGLGLPIMLAAISYNLERSQIKLFLESKVNTQLYQEIKNILQYFPEAICLHSPRLNRFIFKNQAFDNLMKQGEIDLSDDDACFSLNLFMPVSTDKEVILTE